MADEIKYKNKFLRGWMKIVRPIGVFQTYLIMTVIFVVVVPFFSLKRVLDPLRLRIRREGSYWEPRRPLEDLSLERFHRPF